MWLRWQLDQRVIASREVPIEVHYESFGNYHEIYAHYLIVRSVKKENFCIYIRTTVGHISFYREIEEAIQGFLKPVHMIPNNMLLKKRNSRTPV